MSTVVALDDREQTALALCKGAPEKMLEFFSKDKVPADYEETYKHYSRMGARVIALGYKKLKSAQTSESVLIM
jgi:cation-transporting ATPase 13A1